MNDPSKDNEALHQILGQWKVGAPLPPRFQEKVWRRIELTEAQRKWTFLGAFVNWLQTTLPRRAIAVSYSIVFLALGLATGFWHGQQAASRLDSALGLRYVQSVDPYQAVRPALAAQ